MQWAVMIRTAAYRSVLHAGAQPAAYHRFATASRTLSIVLAVIVVAACAYPHPAIDLETALTLRVVDAPVRVEAGQPIEVTFAVKNLSDVALSLCSPSGVTMQLRSEQPAYTWPIVIHGLTTDTSCSGPFNLAPGEEKAFVERGAIRRDLPEGSASLSGRISLSCDPRQRPRCTEAQLETHQLVQLKPPA